MQDVRVGRDAGVGSTNPLRVLFVGPAPLSHVGGAEISTRHLVTSLASRGHEVVVVTSSRRRSAVGVVDVAVTRLTGRTRKHVESWPSFTAHSSVRPVETMGTVIADLDPDVVVVTGTNPGFASSALGESVDRPSVLYVRVEASAHVTLESHVDLTITNSEFMANVVRQLGVEATFLPSIFPMANYHLTTSRQNVLFVNPIPKKGVEIALSLARSRPDIPFVFNLSWRMKPRALSQLRRTARRLGNVEIRKPTHDPAFLFRDCRILLVPSQWAEAWARVVSEAQISGIPVIASRVGGLPESVGPGGLLVNPPDSKEAWLDALSAVWDDWTRYEELSESALRYSQRDQLSPDAVTGQFEVLLERCIENHARCS